jgi:hypothetical protein
MRLSFVTLQLSLASTIAIIRPNRVRPFFRTGAVLIRTSVTRISNTNREPIDYARSQLPTPGRVLTKTAPELRESLEPFLLIGRFSLMVHNNIEFSVHEREAGVWRWEYTIGELIKSGELIVSSRVMASRKVRQQIDRDLRILYRAQRERGIQI